MSGAQETPAPSVLNGQYNQAKGAVYETIATISSDPSWKTEGEAIRKAGEEELAAVKAQAGADRIWGKAESAYGMVTGDQETLSDGNLNAEKGEWKAALADGALPSISVDRLKGKVESAVGMVTGDVAKQSEGNVEAEKAEWLKG